MVLIMFINMTVFKVKRATSDDGECFTPVLSES
jgi:hypothetical protein